MTRDTVPVDMRHQALGTGYREIAALMRTRLRDKAIKQSEVASIEQSIAGVRRLYYLTMRGTVVLTPFIPSFSDASKDASCIGVAYPWKGDPAVTYTIVPVRRSELFSGAVPTVTEARLSLLFSSCKVSPSMIIEKQSTRGVDVVLPRVQVSIRTHLDTLAKAYQYLILQSLCPPNVERKKREASGRVSANCALRFSSAASVFRQLVMLDAVAYTAAGRWKRANELTPLLSFLACHAVIGLRGTTLFVLYE